MLVLAMLPPVLGILAIACIAFFFSIAIPALRRYALGMTLWLGAVACFIPTAFFVNVVIVGLLTEQHLHAHVPLNALAVHRVEAVALVNMLAIIIVATASSLAHGFIVRRLTFALFRIYVAVVTAALAVTLAWVSYLLADIATGSTVVGLFACLLSIALALSARFTYRHAQRFRGARPQWVQPVSAAEYMPAAIASPLAHNIDAS